MSKRRDNFTGDLLAWEPPKVTVGFDDTVAGHGHLDNRIARLVSHALKAARDDQKLQRSDVALRMSDFLGRRISDEMLNKWASEASDNHRMPLDAFIALIEVTDSKDLLGFVPNRFGYAVVPVKYADIIELHLIEEHEREVADRKAQVAARVRAKR